MILELDMGNSRAKWRVLDEAAGTVAQGVVDTVDWFDRPLPEAWTEGVSRIRVASVLAAETERRLTARLRTELSVEVEYARPTAVCAGVTCAYASPEHLGVDRWLALLAAFRRCGAAAMVVDVGTALKVDVVDDAGLHLGGYIIPGAALMERALFDGTDRVRYTEGAPLASVELGTDTRACVQHGVAASLVGAVMLAIAQVRAAVGRVPALYMSGGQGARLGQHLLGAGVKADIRLEADLVLDGLRLALP